MTTDNLRRRNIYFGLALTCIAVAIMYALVVAQLWHHGPTVAGAAVVLAVIFFVLWWRTPRT